MILVRYFVLLLFLVTLMMSVVRKRNLLTDGGYKVARMEEEVRRLSERVGRMRLLYQRLTSAALLRSRVEALQLPLVPAAPLKGVEVEDEPSD